MSDVADPSAEGVARRATAAGQAADEAAGQAADGAVAGLDHDLYEQPGHLIRRAQQIAVSMFLDAVGRDLTPVQYAVLRMLQERPGIDQVTLAREVALDTSTTADIAARLEAKGWIERRLLPRRQRSLVLTEPGRELLARLIPGIHRLNAEILEPLSPPERAQFIHLLRKFVRMNNAQSRAPLASRDQSEG